MLEHDTSGLASRSHELEVVRDPGRGRSGAHVELAVDRAEMHSDGQGTESKLGRHLGRGEALCH